jgi:hypothetical protein
MRATFEFVLAYAKSFAKQHKQLFQSLKTGYRLVFGCVEKAQVHQISGLVKNSNNTMTTLFIGKERVAHQFASIVYCRIDKMLTLGEFRLKQILSSPATNKTDVIVANVEKPTAFKLEKQGYLLLPIVSFRLDLRRPIDHIIKKMSRRRRRDLKKVEALNYSYTLCRGNDKSFDFFYSRMYLPYISSRFGEASSIKSYAESKAYYRRDGGIVFVRKSGNPVAGILFRIIGKTLYAYILGLHQGGEEFSEYLATQAALLFLIKYAKSNNMKSLDYGISLPFFREGVFMYKKEWGMNIEEPIDQSFFALKLSSLGEGSRSFLQHDPFIVSDNGKLKGIVFLDHKATKEELHRIFAQYFLPKLRSLIFISYCKSSEGSQDQGELSNEPSFSNTLKPLIRICQLFEKNAFRVEASELTA